MQLFDRKTTAWELLQKEQPILSFECAILNDFLGSGLRPGLIELAGEAGCGKTQIALTLTLQCLLQPEKGGRGEGVLYINTEGSFPFKRLVQMGLKRSFDVTQCDHLHINSAPDFESVLKSLQQIEIIVKSEKIRLVVLDSLGHVARASEDYICRAKKFYTLSRLFNKLAHEHGIITLCINQVTDVFPDDYRFVTSFRGAAHKDGGDMVAPALGLSWGNCVSTRLMLTIQRSGLHERYLRHLLILSCPYLEAGTKKMQYEINDSGVYGVQEENYV